MIDQKELQHLGELLKKRRLERNISLKEIENATSIRMNYLSAIEEAQMEKLISPIYAHGFIKKYASFLDLEVEDLLTEFPLNLKPMDEETSPEKHEFTLGIGSVEVRGGGSSEIKWLPNLLWVGLSVLGILAAWFLAKYFDIL